MRSTTVVLAAIVMVAPACASTSTTTTTTTSTTTTASSATTATTGPASTTTNGRFVWHDLVTDDLEAAESFYGQLLGWEFTRTTRQGRPYVVVRHHGQIVGGLVQVDPVADSEVSQWIGYQSVSDVDAAVDAVNRGGGRTIVAPVNVDGVGRAAVVADPQGAAFGVLRLNGAAPADTPPADGAFFWMECLAREPAAAVAFYADAFGFQARVTDRAGADEYTVLSIGRPRAGVLALPRPELRPTWLSYVLVSDPVAMAARARTLGGMVMLEPNAGIRKGSLTVVADPSGAIVALQKYPF